ncbi:hypothetical protein [Phenylobacterium sp.]|jgi:hypothetical protein|uniref:hypothetical protein n=1 Tax=Phenylobacterium sp. TaxID=1871053 RepID=UPI002F934BB8
MMSRIERIRRADLLRRASKSETADEAAEAEVVNLPVPVGRARTVPPRDERPSGAAAFAAQLMGQDGERRGLKAGAPLMEAAKTTYSKIEWSGAKDRRARKGRITRTDV